MKIGDYVRLPHNDHYVGRIFRTNSKPTGIFHDIAVKGREIGWYSENELVLLTKEEALIWLMENS